MKKFLTVAIAASFVAGTTLASTAQASAHGHRHHHRHHHHHECMAANPHVGELAVLGLMLGAVTGGVGSAVAYGGAYAVGGAAIGGGTGLLFGAVHEHHHCY